MTSELSVMIREKLREYLKDTDNSKDFITILSSYLGHNLLRAISPDVFSLSENTDGKVKVSVYTDTYTSTIVLTSIILNSINLFILNHINGLELKDTLKSSEICTNKHMYKVFNIDYNEDGKFEFTI